MPAPSRPLALMVQGTGSDVGKSLIVAGLCRAYLRRGLNVAPFKPQNMSNNAAIAADGGEIGRAQALQARACRLPPSHHMNPILLKPEAEARAQLVVRGAMRGPVSARGYHALKPALLAEVLASFAEVGRGRDLVIAEGAGSLAETNLRIGDIANMGFARAARVPVIVAGDIDRGGVIAALVGTHAVLEPADRRLVRGFIINKLRGDPALFTPALAEIERRCRWRAFGVVPWFEAAARLPAEDGASLARIAMNRDGPIKVVVPRLPRIANFDDLDPLAQEPDIRLEFVAPGRALPGDAALVVLPGSKSTLADLAGLKAEGWNIDLIAHRRRGGMILGLCGGYQMLGRTIADPLGMEGPPGESAGLGLLDVATMMGGDKRLVEVAGTALGTPVRGYEMHLGTTEGPDRARPFLSLEGRPEGAVSADGLVAGTYLHGLFGADEFRSRFLARFRPGSEKLPGGETPGYDARVEAVLDDLAIHLETHLDLDAVLAAARRPRFGRSIPA